jgi:hypothetical protein
MRATGRFDDQLLAGPAEVRRALQKVWVLDAEPVQGGLERSGVLAEVAGDGQFGFGRALTARAGIGNFLNVSPLRSAWCPLAAAPTWPRAAVMKSPNAGRAIMTQC